jgi:polygalacturonase
MKHQYNGSGGSGAGWFLALMVVGTMLAAPGRLRAAEVDGWSMAAEILERIQAPTFPGRIIDLRAHGAKGDAMTDCRPAFQAAIDACSAAGGGRVLVPAGVYLCNGPIHLRSDVELHLVEGATILFGTNPDDYLVGDADKGGGVLVRWEGTRCYNYSPLIYAHGQRNIAITGRGIIDGQTGKGWAQWKKLQGPAQKALRAMGAQGTPIEQRILGRERYLRPTLVGIYESQNVLIEGVTIKSSPFWTIHPVACTNVIVRGVRVQPGTTNDDGVNPESCTDVLIEDCTFDTRDDNIAIKSGRDNDAWPAAGGRPSQNIIIRRCTFTRGNPGGISFGSEMSGGVRNIFVEDCTMERVGYAIYAKSNPDRGGFVENVRVRNLTVNQCQILLRAEMDYKNVTAGDHPPTFGGFHLEGVTCRTASRTAIDCSGLAAAPIRGITLRNITVESTPAPLKTINVQGLRMVEVRINGQTLDNN